jgi:hypothetical protein
MSLVGLILCELLETRFCHVSFANDCLDNFWETKQLFHLGYSFQIIRTISDIIFGDINESNLQVLIN